MTQRSANPRRYSKGDELDPYQPLSIYLALKINESDFSKTLERIQYLTEVSPAADVSFAGYHREEGHIVLTLGICVGPARDALRNQTPKLEAGHAFIYDAIKTLFYATPIFCSPPHKNERDNISKIKDILPSLSDHKEEEIQSTL